MISTSIKYISLIIISLILQHVLLKYIEINSWVKTQEIMFDVRGNCGISSKDNYKNTINCTVVKGE